MLVHLYEYTSIELEHGDREERAACNHSRRQDLGPGRGRAHGARAPYSREEVSSTEGGAASAVEGATRSSNRCASATTRGRAVDCCGCASGSAACERAGLLGGGGGCCWPPAVLLLLLLLLLLAGPMGAAPESPTSAEPELELERGTPEADEETPAAASCGGIGGEAASALLVAFESSAACAHGKAVQCTGHRQCASSREAFHLHLHLRTRSPASLRERAASSACAPCFSCSNSGPDLWRARRSLTSVPVVLSTSTARLLS